ncbi:MAG: AMP-binding protein, partial [Pseudonocardiaceae bacterium]|nr:AMP-binding protein [Pseudonocardiaceae bacterium]
DVPPSRWELHADAAEAVAELAASGVLPERARWFSSPEPKALATARLLTATSVTVYDALGEVRRPAGRVGDLTEHARRGFAEPDVPALPGWEMYVAARTRISRGVKNVLAGLANLVAGVVFILVADVNWTAAGLVAAGIGVGDVVALCLPTSPDHVVAYAACAKIGALCAGVNP